MTESQDTILGAKDETEPLLSSIFPVLALFFPLKYGSIVSIFPVLALFFPLKYGGIVSILCGGIVFK